MSYITITARDIEALVKAIKLGEEVKPSQQAKRDIFREYGISGTVNDRILTAIYYDIWKRIGIIDRIICELTGISNVAILDPWLRAALRVAIEILLFERFLKESQYRDAKNVFVKYLKSRIAGFLSKVTHPYVGMYFWELVDKISTYRLEIKNLYEDLEVRYLVSRFIIDKIIGLVGIDEAKNILREFNSRYPISIRVNILKSNVDEVLNTLRNEGINAEIGKYVKTIIKFRGPYDFDKSPLYREGKIVIQDEASALASIILNPKPGEVVVDLCAAPGGKAEHMGELMNNTGVIYAFDIDKARIKRMQKILNRCGINIVKIFNEDARRAPEILGRNIADKVLVDAPCTSSGTIMKNQELRWRITKDEIAKATKLQYELLKTAIELVKPGGRILYTTCSLFREENEDIIDKILRNYDNVKIIPINGPLDPGFIPGTMRAWPHKHKLIGFFYALLQKIR